MTDSKIERVGERRGSEDRRHSTKEAESEEDRRKDARRLGIDRRK